MRADEADRDADRVYDYLEGQFGQEDPRSSGYRSVRYFQFEAGVIRDVLRRYEGSILDVACGHGLISGPLVSEGRTVSGLDFNQTAVGSAARKGLLARHGDAFRMPYEDASFDVVLSTEFIQQYDPDQSKRLMDELVRVTRPGGVIVLTWRNGSSLMRQLITRSLRIVDWACGRPALKLFDHHFDTVSGWARVRHAEVVDSLSICPVFGLTIRGAESWGSKLLGTSYLAVLLKRQ